MVLDVGVLVDLCEPELQGLATASLQQLSLYPSPGLGGGDDNDKLGAGSDPQQTAATRGPDQVAHFKLFDSNRRSQPRLDSKLTARLGLLEDHILGLG